MVPGAIKGAEILDGEGRVLAAAEGMWFNISKRL